MPTKRPTRTALINLLSDQITHHQREALMVEAFGDDPLLRHIDVAGTPYEFACHIVGICQQHPHLADGDPTLAALLNTLARHVGDNHQREIAALRDQLASTPAAPTMTATTFTQHLRERCLNARLHVWADPRLPGVLLARGQFDVTGYLYSFHVQPFTDFAAGQLRPLMVAARKQAFTDLPVMRRWQALYTIPVIVLSIAPDALVTAISQTPPDFHLSQGLTHPFVCDLSRETLWYSKARAHPLATFYSDDSREGALRFLRGGFGG